MITRQKRNAPLSEILLFFFFVFFLSHFDTFSTRTERPSETRTFTAISHLQVAVNLSNEVVRVYVKKLFPDLKPGCDYKKQNSPDFYSAIECFKKSNILSSQIKALIQSNYYKLQKVPDEPWDLA
jgi:hypothetical protein